MTDSSIPISGAQDADRLQTFANDIGGTTVHAEAVTIVDKNGVDCTDEYIHGIAIIPTEHKAIHDGVAYFADLEALGTLTAGATYNVAITTPASGAIHLRGWLFGANNGPCTTVLYEGSTTSGGTSVTPKNFNRLSSNTTSVTVAKGVTVSATGTALQTDLISADKNSSGLPQTQELEWILKRSTTYVLRITNNGLQTATIDLNVSWYEV